MPCATAHHGTVVLLFHLKMNERSLTAAQTVLGFDPHLAGRCGQPAGLIHRLTGFDSRPRYHSTPRAYRPRKGTAPALDRPKPPRTLQPHRARCAQVSGRGLIPPRCAHAGSRPLGPFPRRHHARHHTQPLLLPPRPKTRRPQRLLDLDRRPLRLIRRIRTNPLPRPQAHGPRRRLGTRTRTTPARPPLRTRPHLP